MARGRVCKEDQGGMNKALEKNRRALQAVGLDGASHDLIETARIGVWTGASRPAFMSQAAPNGAAPRHLRRQSPPSGRGAAAPAPAAHSQAPQAGKTL